MRDKITVTIFGPGFEDKRTERVVSEEFRYVASKIKEVLNENIDINYLRF